MHRASQVRTNRNMSIIIHDAVMINACASIDNAALAYLGIRIDNDARHNDGSPSDLCTSTDHSRRMNKSRNGIINPTLDSLSHLHISYRNDELSTIRQRSYIGGFSNNRKTRTLNCFIRIIEKDYVAVTASDSYVRHDLAMATRANDN